MGASLQLACSGSGALSRTQKIARPATHGHSARLFPPTRISDLVNNENSASQAPRQGSISFWDRLEPAFEWAIKLCGWSAILFVLAIFAFVFKEAFPALAWLDLGEFFFSDKWRPEAEENAQYGIFALLVGTGCVTLGSTILSVPLGLGAAVYLSEFCSGKMRETLKVVIELLAAIPSIVWGFIGVVVLGPIIIDTTTWLHGMGLFPRAYVGVNILNGSIILARNPRPRP